MAEQEIKKGLAGVVVDYTAVSKVNPDTNSLLYRGYPVQELAANCSFEEVAYLLWNGELPTPEQLAEFTARERAGRAIDPVVKQVVDALPTTSHPMDVCRTAASVMGARHPLAEDSSREANMAKAVDLFAAMPAIVAYDQRRRHGQDVVAPRDDLGYSANFLWMAFGEEPVQEVVEAFNVSMILYAEHSFNASTFTARVICSSGADVAAAVVGGMGALSGPLHGGAPSRALDLLDAIGTAENARPYLVDAVTKGEKIMGFGHRVYKTDDPRSTFLRGVAERIGAEKIDFAKAVERTVVEVLAELKPGRDLYANVEFYAGVVMDHCGLPRELFTPTFASSRVIGWCANILEQAADNRIIRPSARYVGPPPPQPVPDLD
ncbi:citrate/2-methylcitrate synthase [uncultured Arthrobacter sp.]|uniref:citrate/2-methylcitrate synthase n=1 Tax=uncultured Arthrobacter sp. TaxID=114050 RepID=UPI003217ACE4